MKKANRGGSLQSGFHKFIDLKISFKRDNVLSLCASDHFKPGTRVGHKPSRYFNNVPLKGKADSEM